MDKEALKRNIEQAIKEGGTFEDGSIRVQCEPDDSVRNFHPTEDGFVDRLIDALPKKYRDKLVTIIPKGWLYDYKPVFDAETQEMWNKEYKAFAGNKAAFCAKWGCN